MKKEKDGEQHLNTSIAFLRAIDTVWQAPMPDAVMARARQSLLD